MLELLQKKENWVAFLQNSWIRPEDLHNYDTYFSMAKLATRMHANPRKVIQAYCEQRFQGNLLDLLEPGHSPLFSPYLIDNTKFPEDWFKRTSTCDKKCHQCDYCSEVLKKVLVRIGDTIIGKEGEKERRERSRRRAKYPLRTLLNFHQNR